MGFSHRRAETAGGVNLPKSGWTTLLKPADHYPPTADKPPFRSPSRRASSFFRHARENNHAIVNPRGQVVGGSTTRSGEGHAFIWDRGVMTDLGTLGRKFAVSAANAINARGDVVGVSSTDADIPEARATLWTRKSPRVVAAE